MSSLIRVMPSFRALFSACMLIGAALLATAAPAAETDARAPLLVVTLRPTAGVPGSVYVVHVSIAGIVPPTASGKPLIDMPVVIANVATEGGALQGLRASDSAGALSIDAHKRKVDGSERWYWVATRQVRGAVSIHYDVAITDAPNSLGAAPPFELRSADQVFSGLLGTFVPFPSGERTYRLALRWDLSALHGEKLGVSTIGVGDVATPTALAPDKLRDIFVMGGANLGREPDTRAPDGFFSVWQGTPPFNATSLMRWTHQLYKYYLQFFGVSKPTYSVYLRRNLTNPGGGVEVGDSFVGTYGRGVTVEAFKLTLAHEMVHTFVGAPIKSGGELASSWFAEGIAVYYQRLLPWQAGMINTQQYLKDINETAARYYTDKLNDTPNSKIPSEFWKDTRVRVLPYDRGSLYFAQVNYEIRRATNGKHGLSDVLLHLLRTRQQQGKDLTDASWISAMVQVLGKRGESQFQDMMDGKEIVLAPGTFGRCFTRTSIPLRRYQLGFDPSVLVTPPRIVRGLVAGSNAAKAGLRNGDQIIDPVAQDAIQGNQTAMLLLHVKRAGAKYRISYLPRGATVSTYQWVETRAPGCR